MSVTLADRVRKTMKAAWQELDGETVLLVAGEEKLLGLNPVAARIWQLADGFNSVAAIAQALDAEFDARDNDLPQDTLVFVNELVGRGLLERCPS